MLIFILFSLKKRGSDKHRGEVLNDVVRKAGIKVNVLAKEVGYDRTSYYNHVKDPELPYTVIAKYGVVLKHDFSEEFPDVEDFATRDSDNTITTFEEMKASRDFWKRMYNELFEKQSKDSK